MAFSRRRLAWGGSFAVVGIGISVLLDQTIGGFVTVAAVAFTVQALHRFGRTGPG